MRGSLTSSPAFLEAGERHGLDLGDVLTHQLGWRSLGS
jgi:hypothetical protein